MPPNEPTRANPAPAAPTTTPFREADPPLVRSLVSLQEAVEAMQRGRRVRRAAWNSLSERGRAGSGPRSFATAPFLLMMPGHRDDPPNWPPQILYCDPLVGLPTLWTPTVADIMTTDWQILPAEALGEYVKPTSG